MGHAQHCSGDAGSGISQPFIFFFFQAEDGIRDLTVTGVQTCALPIFAHLVLRREDGRNAIPPALLDELEGALAAVAEAQHVKLLVLRGEGKVFSVGVDLAAIEALPPREALDFFRRGQTLIRRLEGLNALTVAAINGLALGGGFELALACDLRWAHARAVFRFPECKRGLIPAWGGIRFLDRKSVV